jgi:hypothetical protein
MRHPSGFLRYERRRAGFCTRSAVSAREQRRRIGWPIPRLCETSSGYIRGLGERAFTSAAYIQGLAGTALASLKGGGAGGGTSLLRNSTASTPRRLVFAPLGADRAQLRSVFLECLRQPGVSEDICYPFEVVGHDCEAELGVSSYPSAQEEAWMTEDAVFDGRERMPSAAASSTYNLRTTGRHAGPPDSFLCRPPF